MRPNPYFMAALGFDLLSHHLENKGASVMIKNEFKIPNQEAPTSVASLLNSLFIFQITIPQSAINAIAKMILE